MYMSSVKDKVNQIVKFIDSFYEPKKIKVVDFVISDKKNYTIGVYFENISDDYISNSEFHDIKKLKEHNLTREIRTYIENYLGIKTSGLQPKNNFLPPPENHLITIVTQSDK